MKGQVTVLDFVAPNCRFSKRQLARLENIRRIYEGRGVQFAAVRQIMGKRFSREEAERRIRATGFQGELIHDPDNSIGRQFSVWSFPSLFVVGTDARVGDVIMGNVRDFEQRLRLSLETALADGKPAKPTGPETGRDPFDERTRTFVGTGFAISRDGHILTANHIVANCDNVRVRFAKGEWRTARLLKQSSIFDAALLKVATSNAPHLSLCDPGFSKQGQRVFTIGYPAPGILGREAKYTEGVISSTTGLADEASLLQVTVPLQPGNSGGALVTLDGCVVGIITSSVAVAAFLDSTGTLPQNVNWAINADYVRDFLSEFKELSQDTAEDESARTRDELLETVRNATCMVEARSTP